MLRTKIKASAITNLTDARYFAAWHVAWMGFCLDPADEAYVSPQVMQAITGWIDGPLVVGEFNMQSAIEIREAIQVMDLDMVQAGPFTAADTLRELQSPVPVIKEWAVDRESHGITLLEEMDAFAKLASLHLLNFRKSGISFADLHDGRPFTKEALAGICEMYPVLLDIDCNPDELDELLREASPEGLCLTGGAEERVGYKSYDEIDLLLEALEEEV